MKKLDVIIVDDQKLFAQSLKVVFDSASEYFGKVIVTENGMAAVQIIQDIPIDLIIMDVWMPGIDGIKTTQEIRKYNFDVKIIMLSAYGYDKYVKSAFRAGANGYLLKDITPDELLSAIQKVYKGQKVISKEINDYLEGIILESNTPLEYPTEIDALTQREKEILSLIGKGFGNEEIATQLYLSEHTVRNYISSINDKLGTKSRFEAMRLAIEYHIESLL